MSDVPPHSDPDAPEPGEPVSWLQDLGADPSPDFVPRVRRAIERRFLTRDVLTFGWRALATWTLEFVSMLAALFGRLGRPRTEEGQGS
ncbi:MAG: hypothetical protein ACRD2X_03325 [Vicinamibacteraceae bacterium]